MRGILKSPGTYDIPDSPPIVQRPDDQDQLTDRVDQETDGGENQVGDEQPDRFRLVKACEVLEGGDRDEEADTPDDQGR